MTEETRQMLLDLIEEYLDEYGSLVSYRETTERVLAAKAELQEEGELG